MKRRPPTLSEQIRDVMKRRKWAQEERRIASQRALFAALPDSEEKQALRLAMLERVFYIFVNAEAPSELGDIILEFMSEADCDEVLRLAYDSDEEFDEKFFPVPLPNPMGAK